MNGEFESSFKLITVHRNLYFNGKLQFDVVVIATDKFLMQI